MLVKKDIALTDTHLRKQALLQHFKIRFVSVSFIFVDMIFFVVSLPY